MIFRQPFDRETCTHTYLLADEETREAVRENIDRDSRLLKELGLRLVITLETHVHGDHITAAGLLRSRLGSEVRVSAQILERMGFGRVASLAGGMIDWNRRCLPRG